MFLSIPENTEPINGGNILYNQFHIPIIFCTINLQSLVFKSF